MNVSCPDCRSIFRVDPAKVPPSGVRARCSVCSGVITIPAPTGQTTPAGGGPRAATPASSAPVERARPTPPASPGWDSSPYSGQARQTPAAPPVQRVAPVPPPAAPTAPPAPPDLQSGRPTQYLLPIARARAAPLSRPRGLSCVWMLPRRGSRREATETVERQSRWAATPSGLTGHLHPVGRI